jgi:hypothetical protein
MSHYSNATTRQNSTSTIRAATSSSTLSLHDHFEWSVAERLVAKTSPNRADAAIHLAMAEMHEFAMAKNVNDSLAP